MRATVAPGLEPIEAGRRAEVWLSLRDVSPEALARHDVGEAVPVHVGERHRVGLVEVECPAVERHDHVLGERTGAGLFVPGQP